MPNTPDLNRIYDRIFIGGTYADAGCLLVAASHDHAIAWHQTKYEATHAYTQLPRKTAEPLCVVLDDEQDVLTVIKAC